MSYQRDMAEIASERSTESDEEYSLPPHAKKIKSDEDEGRNVFEHIQEQSNGGTSTAKVPDYQSYVSRLPADILEKELDWDNEVGKDLNKIAKPMLHWEEELSTLLDLTEVQIHDIVVSIQSPELKRREALQIWKKKYGHFATYEKLLHVFVDAGHTVCAKALCETLISRKQVHRSASHSTTEKEDYHPVDSSRRHSYPSASRHIQKVSVHKSSQIIEENISNIHGEFIDLVDTVGGKLDKMDIDIKNFRDFIILIFHLKSRNPDFDVLSNVRDIFQEITLDEKWDYDYYHPIKKIAEKFGDKDLEIMGLIDIYEEKVGSFKATTSLVHYIEACEHIEKRARAGRSLEARKARYTGDQFHKLQVVLDAAVTEKTLDYIDEFWGSIATRFNLPSLPVILDSIISGSVKVTWLIPTRLSLHIQANIQGSMEFFQEQSIAQFKLNDEILYDKEMDEDQFSALCLETQKKLEASLITAAKEADFFAVQRLFEVKVNLNSKEMDEYGWTALMYACEKGYFDIVDFLLEHGADIKAEDVKNWTGLILASRKGYLDIVKKLLDKGADVNKLTNDLWSALMWTAHKGRTEVAQLLLEKGAMTTTRDKAGFTPLIQACQDGKLGVVKLLVEHDSERILEQRTNSGWSAIMAATKNGYEEIVKYLVEKGSDSRYQKEDGIIAFHIASYKGHDGIVRYLYFQNKQEVNTQDEDGITALMFAAKQGNLDVVKTLIGNGHANANITENDYDWTALFFAIEGCHHEVSKYLLRCGRVNMQHKDKRGNTVADIARIFNPTALEYISEYYKVDKVEKKVMDNKASYQLMLNKFENKIPRAVPDAATFRQEVIVGAN